MIDRYLLRYFLAVADCGSFSQAALNVHVAQPTLSVGIRKLEQALGTLLFDRSTKPISMTEAGKRLLSHARRIELEFNIAETEVHEIQTVRILRLGVVSSFPLSIIGEVLHSAIRCESDERVQIAAGDSRDLIRRLNRGSIDAAFTVVGPESAHFVCEPLFSEGYSMALHAKHHLADRKSIVAAELADTPAIIRRHCEVKSETSAHFIKQGVRPFVAFRGSNDEQVMTLIQAGLGGALMPASFARDGVVRLSLDGFDLRRDIGIIYAQHASHLIDSDSPLINELRKGFAG